MNDRVTIAEALIEFFDSKPYMNKTKFAAHCKTSSVTINNLINGSAKYCHPTTKRNLVKGFRENGYYKEVM